MIPYFAVPTSRDVNKIRQKPVKFPKLKNEILKKQYQQIANDGFPFPRWSVGTRGKLPTTKCYNNVTICDIIKICVKQKALSIAAEGFRS